MKRVIREEHYLRAARCLCSEMYENGIENVALKNNGKPLIIKVVDLLIYLSEKIEEVSE